MERDSKSRSRKDTGDTPKEAEPKPEKKHPLLTSDQPHIRLNILTGEWVLVSPNRMKRPWLGQIENLHEEIIPEFDPENPLCPGVKRPNGEVNPNYRDTYIFNNDFPALVEYKPPKEEQPEETLFQVKPAIGLCKVMCLHPKSNVTFGQFSKNQIIHIIEQWSALTEELGRKYAWVQIFENRGGIMGCSNPHPHCQIWASAFLPNSARQKDASQLAYYKKHGRPMLMDYLEQELQKRDRIVLENEDWVVLVPFWALWPFETMILPKTHIKRFSDLKSENPKIISLATIMKKLVTKYDNLFKCVFPYTMGWHGAPTGKKALEESTHWLFHGMYYPPLLRSCTIKKFMVGYEMLAQGQRDLTPEAAAVRLRTIAETPSYMSEESN